MPSPYSKSRTRYIPIYRYSMNLAPQTSQPDRSLIVYYYSRAMTGNLLPKWKQIIRQGGNATTGFAGNENTLEVAYPYMNLSYRREVSPGNKQLYRTYDSSFSNWLNLNPIGVHAGLGVEQEATAQAIGYLYQALHKARHQLQGGVILGQIHKTARQMTGVAKRFKQTVAQTVTGMSKVKSQVKNSKAAVRRKALANAYLEETFGWQPLIKDVQDAAIALARIIHFKDRTRLRVGATSEKSISHGMSELTFGSLRANSVLKEFTQCEVIYRGFLQGTPYQAGVAPLERIISLSGFDLGSFIPTMWELVPYSWLVDYFVNIGDVMYALSADTSLVSGLWKTVRTETTREYFVTPNFAKSLQNLHADPLNTNGICTGQAGHYTIKYRTVTRSLSEVPYLMPRLKGIDLGWRQFANIGALFAKR
jgi:hypothetical protein